METYYSFHALDANAGSLTAAKMIAIQNPKIRKLLRYLIPFVLIPLSAILGTTFLDEKHHLFVSLFIAILSLFLFIAGFEKKITGSRRLVIVAVMTALSITGRFIPFFKPVTSLTVITAVYLGGESGFLVGSLSALLSNFYFGQGPWTPFQMLAWGLIGLISGYLSKILQKSRTTLVIFGVLSGILFSLIMDIWTVLWYDNGFNISLYLSSVVTALPHTLLYSVSNFIFLWFMAKPFGDKLNRIKIKYGI